MIKTIVLVALWMFVIPCIIGLGVLKLDKKKNKNVFLAIVLGFFIELLVFEILSVPMTFKGKTFTALKNIWTIIILALATLSALINIRDYKEIFKKNFDGIKTIPKFLTITFIILLAIQCYIPFKYMHKDYDDSNFLAKATIAIDNDSLFVYDDAGNEYKEFPTRTVLSQFPHFTAIISVLCDIHPTILAHTIFPAVFIVMVYGFYYVLGMTLFKKDQNKTMIFLNILAVVFIYGSYSRYTNFVRILYRAWQGKSILANLTLPFIWYVFMECIGKENSKFGWFILFIALGGSIALSSMAFILPVITVLILMFIYAIKDKKIGYVIALILCAILCVLVISVYLKTDDQMAKNSALKNEELTNKEKIEELLQGIDDEKNIKTIEETFDRAGGPRYYIPIFGVSIIFIYITCKKDNKDVLAVFSVFSVIVWILNLNPIYSKIWSMILGDGVYWRTYWLLPIGYSIAFMFTEIVCLADKRIDRIVAMVLTAAIIMITGVNVYNPENFEPTDNYFKIPDWVLEMIFEISEDEEEYKKLGAPEDFSVYTRQVDGNIVLAQMRNVGGYYSKNSLVKLSTDGTSEEIYTQAIKQKCNYIIIPKTSYREEDPLTNYGFEEMHDNEKYILYKIDLDKNANLEKIVEKKVEKKK